MVGEYNGDKKLNTIGYRGIFQSRMGYELNIDDCRVELGSIIVQCQV